MKKQDLWLRPVIAIATFAFVLFLARQWWDRWNMTEVPIAFVGMLLPWSFGIWLISRRPASTAIQVAVRFLLAATIGHVSCLVGYVIYASRDGALTRIWQTSQTVLEKAEFVAWITLGIPMLLGGIFLGAATLLPLNLLDLFRRGEKGRPKARLS